MLAVTKESLQETTVKATKAVAFSYSSSDKLRSLFEDFRLMCNDAIRIAVQEKPKNRFKLIELAYARLKQYCLHTHYILSACEVAYSVYRNKKRKSTPYIKRAFLKLDAQSYQLNHLLLRIPTSPRNFIFLTLQGSEYHLSVVDEPELKRGSVTITPSSVVVAFSKRTEPLEPTGFVGLDINERNVTASANNGWTRRFDELGEVLEIKERYKEIRASISQKMRGDRRVSRMLLSRYGMRERNRSESRIHKVTSQVVGYAREHTLGIKMEEAQGDKEALQEREWSGCVIQREDELLGLRGDPEAGGLQVEVGRGYHLLRQPPRNVPKLPGLWLPRRTTAGQETVLPEVRQDLG